MGCCMFTCLVHNFTGHFWLEPESNGAWYTYSIARTLRTHINIEVTMREYGFRSFLQSIDSLGTRTCSKVSTVTNVIASGQDFFFVGHTKIWCFWIMENQRNLYRVCVCGGGGGEEAVVRAWFLVGQTEWVTYIRALVVRSTSISLFHHIWRNLIDN